MSDYWRCASKAAEVARFNGNEAARVDQLVVLFPLARALLGKGSGFEAELAPTGEGGTEAPEGTRSCAQGARVAGTTQKRPLRK